MELIFSCISAFYDLQIEVIFTLVKLINGANSLDHLIYYPEVATAILDVLKLCLFFIEVNILIELIVRVVNWYERKSYEYEKYLIRQERKRLQ